MNYLASAVYLKVFVETVTNDVLRIRLSFDELVELVKILKPVPKFLQDLLDLKQKEKDELEKKQQGEVSEQNKVRKEWLQVLQKGLMQHKDQGFPADTFTYKTINPQSKKPISLTPKQLYDVVIIALLDKEGKYAELHSDVSLLSEQFRENIKKITQANNLQAVQNTIKNVVSKLDSTSQSSLRTQFDTLDTLFKVQSPLQIKLTALKNALSTLKQKLELLAKKLGALKTTLS